MFLSLALVLPSNSKRVVWIDGVLEVRDKECQNAVKIDKALIIVFANWE